MTADVHFIMYNLTITKAGYNMFTGTYDYTTLTENKTYTLTIKLENPNAPKSQTTIPLDILYIMPFSFAILLGIFLLKRRNSSSRKHNIMEGGLQ